MIAIPPTAPPTIGPMGREDFAAAASVEDGVEVEDEDVPEPDVLLAPAELSKAVSTGLVVSAEAEAEIVTVAGTCCMSSSDVCGTFAQAMTE